MFEIAHHFTHMPDEEEEVRISSIALMESG